MLDHRHRVARASLLSLAALTGFVACKSTTQDAPKSEGASAVVAAKVAPPAAAADKPADLPGIHNVVAYSEGIYSGSAPDSVKGLDAIAGMGVKTIISVDGAAPDAEEARARGMRYIHLPISYAGFDEARKLEITKATAEGLKDGPVYIHCHHGKHRSAGAAGAAAVCLGRLSAEDAVKRMKVSGTAPDYKGLYAAAQNAQPLSPEALAAIPTDFPSVARPKGIVKGMIDIDEAHDQLKKVEKNGWKVPADHPDLVPANEAARLANFFRQLERHEETLAKPADFGPMMKANGERADELKKLLQSGADAKALSDKFKQVTQACKDCHTPYRD
jgi:protein tyrosine phosphatase (PTP) superfamily phosphohydrolase (DUF442 family)